MAHALNYDDLVTDTEHTQTSSDSYSLYCHTHSDNFFIVLVHFLGAIIS